MADSGARWTSDPLRGQADRSAERARLLLLCDYRPFDAGTVVDHIEAIRAWSRYDVFVLPMLGDLPDELDLEAFDAIVIHYSLVMANDAYVSPLTRWRLSRSRALIAAFIQDEYRFVNDTVGAMRAIGVNVLFTCISDDQVEAVYPSHALPALRRTTTVLTGYVPDHLLARPLVAYERRSVDVAYRGRVLPPWLGSLARQKSVIADRFASDAPAYGLTVDISCREEDRIYGEAWIDFISGARATLGVESGASVFDFDGSIERAIRDHLAVDPAVPFEELHARHLAASDGSIRLNQISPRSFEAAALGTLMVLYPGEYSGILEAGRHYVPLLPDHSNMDEVVAAIRDRATWTRITGQARMEVALNPAYSFRAMVEVVDAALDLRPRPDRQSIDVSRFEAIASGSLDRLRPVHLNARLRLRAMDRISLIVGRIGHGLIPRPVVGTQSGAQDRGRSRRFRDIVRYGRAAIWWLLRPGRVPARALIRGRTRLLEDLSDLAQLQNQGSRAVRSGADSPFVLAVDAGSGEGRLRVRADPDETGSGVSTVPGEAASREASALWLELSDRWLAPSRLVGPGPRKLEAVSAVLRDRPAAGRRLLAGDARWYADVSVRPSGPASGLLLDGDDVQVEAQ